MFHGLTIEELRFRSLHEDAAFCAGYPEGADNRLRQRAGIVINLYDGDGLALERANADRHAVNRIDQLRVTGDALPGAGFEEAATGMRNREEPSTAPIDADRHEATNMQLGKEHGMMPQIVGVFRMVVLFHATIAIFPFIGPADA